jgi:hypothetical protein
VERDCEAEGAPADGRERLEERLRSIQKRPDVVHGLTIAPGPPLGLCAVSGGAAWPQLDDEVAVERPGQALERVDPGRAPPCLESGYCRLGCAAELGELGLRETARVPLLGHLPGDLREQPAVLRVGDALAKPFERASMVFSLTVSHIAIVLYESRTATGGQAPPPTSSSCTPSPPSRTT